MKRALLVLLVALAAAAPAAAARRDLTVDRGIVQSISPTQIVLRSLDGSTLSFRIVLLTRVYLNGQPAALSSIQAGFAAAVAHDARGRAHAIRATGQRQKQIDKGVVVSVSPTLLVLRGTDGSTISVTVGPQTNVLLDGFPARLSDLRQGYLAAAVHYGTAPAKEVRALRRPA